jgi:predicted ATPase
MSKIKIRHFGPIREGFTENDGWMDINKVTVFIGNQGSGKSTVAKLISSFTWMEKVLVRGDRNKAYFQSNECFRKEILAYHRLDGYLKTGTDSNSYLEYEGKAFNIIFQNGHLEIYERKYEYYDLPQIMYVPAERNFIAYVKSPKELKLSSESFQDFLTAFEKAKSDLKGIKRLPVNDTDLIYDRATDTLSLNGPNFHRINLTDASSGFQSLVPLFLVSEHLALSVHPRNQNSESMSNDEKQRFKKEVEEIISNSNLTNDQKKAAINVLSSKFTKNCFINIVEEPEQNLFPESQWKMLQNLISINNLAGSNKLILTTHSPYIINYLSILIQGSDLYLKINKAPYKYHNEFLDNLRREMDLNALLEIEKVSIYEMDEESGTISRLSAKYGIPSDNNYLNNQLKQGNNIFDKLLELEESLPV